MTTVLGAVAIVIFFFVTALFLLSLVIKRNDIADVAWGIGILMTGFVSFVIANAHGPLSKLMLLLATLWGIRLSLRILFRNIRKTEDPRYKVWRDTWGRWFYLRSYLQVYLLQGALMVVVGYPLIHGAHFGGEASLTSLGVIGVIVWCIGFYFEVVGDHELDTFIKNPNKPTKILQSGLWKYTRHPNYFGEITMWWGIWLMIAPLPMSYLALVGPLTITFLILKVSGIPMLEKRFEGDPEFEAYKARTSVLIPLPPKHST